MLPAASGMKSIAWRRTVAPSFFSSASKIALFQTLSWYWKMSWPTTSAISTAVISQATFQLRLDDQKPRAVIQKRRTSGFFCSRWMAVSFDIKTLFSRALSPKFHNTTRPSSKSSVFVPGGSRGGPKPAA